MSAVFLASKWKILLAAALATSTLTVAQLAFAHGFGEQYELPIPLGYFIVGACVAVAVSFLVVGLFVRIGDTSHTYPRHNLLRHYWFRMTFCSPPFLVFLKVLSVALFVLILATSLYGTNRPIENLAPTFVWIIWWVGLGYVSAIFGNVWMLINPWKITYEWIAWLVDRRSSRPYLYRYPEKWGVWPAAILFLLFAWLEIVYSGASEPFKLGLLILGYSLMTWIGMFIFGKHVWLSKGEVFSVLFSLFSRFSPTEVRVTNSENNCGTCEAKCEPVGLECVDCYACLENAETEKREFNLRPYALGLIRPGALPNSMMAFVILALAIVSFDGLSETTAWNSVLRFFQDNFSPGVNDVVNTFGLIFAPIGFLLVYLFFSWLMKRFSKTSESSWELARLFVFSMVPIALAYNVSHYISYLIVQGQAVISLVSDPFGFGWDLFGTADHWINLNVANSKYIWFTSVAVIVLGHVIGVYLAHLVAFREFRNKSFALKSQYPMLGLMVAYTATSLWIISQPLVQP